MAQVVEGKLGWLRMIHYLNQPHFFIFSLNSVLVLKYYFFKCSINVLIVWSIESLLGLFDGIKKPRAGTSGLKFQPETYLEVSSGSK